MGLNIGDKVVLRHTSPFNDGGYGNPLDCIGVVAIVDMYNSKDHNWNRVLWANGTSNSFHESCLKVLGNTGMETTEEVEEWHNAL